MLFFLLFYVLFSGVDIHELAVKTAYSRSDLSEICKYAVVIPIRQFVKQQKIAKRPTTAEEKLQVELDKRFPRPLQMCNFEEAMQAVGPSGNTARDCERHQLLQALKDANARLIRIDEETINSAMK